MRATASSSWRTSIGDGQWQTVSGWTRRRARRGWVIKGVGAVFVTTATLFAIWELSWEHPDVATDHLLSLHMAEAGFVTLERSAESSDGTEQEVPSPGFANRLVRALTT